MQNEPNLTPDTPIAPSLLRNEPNSTRPKANSQSPTAKKHETNPITVPPSASQPERAPIMQNEPNYPVHCHPERRAAKRNAAAQSRGIRSTTIVGGDSAQTNLTRTPNYAKRTQFRPAAALKLPMLLRQSSGIQHYRTWESIWPDNSVKAVIISNVAAKELFRAKVGIRQDRQVETGDGEMHRWFEAIEDLRRLSLGRSRKCC